MRTCKLQKRLSALFIAFVMTALCFIQVYPTASAEAEMKNKNGMYLNEALCVSGYGQYKQSREEWCDFIDKFCRSGYYQLTPYSAGSYAASLRGDMWQFDTPGHIAMMTSQGGNSTDGSMTCTGFVWHAIAHSLSICSGIPISDTGEWVPNLSGFNEQGFSRNVWTGNNGSSRWYDFIRQYGVHYYEFDTKAEMLASGVLKKGDIIWLVDSSVGRKMNGLAIPADNHHVGIYYGNGSSDVWWQSGPTMGDGVLAPAYAYNSVNPIFGCAKSNTYIVLPWEGEKTAEEPQPVNNEPPEPKNPNGHYFNEAMAMAGGGTYTETAEQWQDFIDEYSANDYYKGTPYAYWLYAASPKGDLWQLENEYAKGMITGAGGSAELGGLNCMGFVWHALSNGLSHTFGLPMSVTGQWVPLNSAFNTYFPDRQCWSAGSGWTNYISYYNVMYYEFDSKEEMLSSGVLCKGDIIWTVDGKVGTGFSGLLKLADDHHIGIYTGDGRSDQWWQSGPTKGDGRYDTAETSVNPIYGCSLDNTYVVIPFSSDRSASVPAVTTTSTASTVSTTTTTTVETTAETTAINTSTAESSTSSAPAETTSAASETEPSADTTQAVSTTEAVSTTVPTAAEPTPVTGTPSLGDIDGNNRIDSSDASIVLEAYSLLSVGEDSGLTEEQLKFADVTGDGAVNSADASLILEYYTYLSVGGEKSPEEYFTHDTEPDSDKDDNEPTEPAKTEETDAKKNE